MFFNRRDICEAWYLYCREYHKGQWTYEYRALSRAQRLGREKGLVRHFIRNVSTFNALAVLSDNARAIYDRLVREGT